MGLRAREPHECNFIERIGSSERQKNFILFQVIDEIGRCRWRTVTFTRAPSALPAIIVDIDEKRETTNLEQADENIQSDKIMWTSLSIIHRFICDNDLSPFRWIVCRLCGLRYRVPWMNSFYTFKDRCALFRVCIRDFRSIFLDTSIMWQRLKKTLKKKNEFLIDT